MAKACSFWSSSIRAVPTKVGGPCRDRGEEFEFLDQEAECDDGDPGAQRG